ncbi:MAG: hypothetical protein ACRDPH_06935 [Marmoricola sp.]
MRRVLLLLVAVVLVNLPWAHQAWVDHRIDVAGRSVQARVTQARVVDGRPLVQYRLPARVDPGRDRFSARVDVPHFRRARSSGRIPVQVVPGHPADNRPAGEVHSSLFVVVAAIGDVVVAAVVAVLLWRRRRWWRRTVLARDGDLVTFRMAGTTMTARLAGTRGATVGERLRGDLVLVAESDVAAAPAGAVESLEHLGEARYAVRGRVSDAARDHAELQLDSGYPLRVALAGHRCRADLRELARVSGVLEVTDS